jgi:hypothetical protein
MHIAKGRIHSSFAIKLVDQFCCDNSIVCLFPSKSMEDESCEYQRQVGNESFEYGRGVDNVASTETNSTENLFTTYPPLCEKGVPGDCFGPGNNQCLPDESSEHMQESEIMNVKIEATASLGQQESGSDSDSSTSFDDNKTEVKAEGLEGQRRMRAVLTSEQVSPNYSVLDICLSLQLRRCHRLAALHI